MEACPDVRSPLEPAKGGSRHAQALVLGGLSAGSFGPQAGLRVRSGPGQPGPLASGHVATGPLLDKRVLQRPTVGEAQVPGSAVASAVDWIEVQARLLLPKPAGKNQEARHTVEEADPGVIPWRQGGTSGGVRVSPEQGSALSRSCDGSPGSFDEQLCIGQIPGPAHWRFCPAAASRSAGPGPCHEAGVDHSHPTAPFASTPIGTMPIEMMPGGAIPMGRSLRLPPQAA